MAFTSSSPRATKPIAVLFGGASPEHDVSIVTGLQMIDALDSRAFTPIPVYMTQAGAFFIGETLRDERFYIPSAQGLSACTQVRPERGGFAPVDPAAGAPVRVHAALLALHGGSGEDGRIASLLEMARIPYAGMRPGAAHLCMNKAQAKAWAAAHGIPVLPSRVIKKPAQGAIVPRDELAQALEGLSFPVIVKPNHLGSSIGVAKADDLHQARAALVPLFALDDEAIIEPFVSPLVEYNVAVRRGEAGVVTSAVERPLTSSELLDFKDKYGGGEGRRGIKQSGLTQQGMLALTRDINPALPSDAERALRDHAAIFFDSLGGAGAPRLDFISNGDTGEIWFNEINPTPGSLGFFLWEAGDPPVLYPELLSDLIVEAVLLAERRDDSNVKPPADAHLFPRK